jgi:hypothetical protein
MHVEEAPERCQIKHSGIAASCEQDPDDNRDHETGHASPWHIHRIKPDALRVSSRTLGQAGVLTSGSPLGAGRAGRVRPTNVRDGFRGTERASYTSVVDRLRFAVAGFFAGGILLAAFAASVSTNSASARSGKFVTITFRYVHEEQSPPHHATPGRGFTYVTVLTLYPTATLPTRERPAQGTTTLFIGMSGGDCSVCRLTDQLHAVFVRVVTHLTGGSLVAYQRNPGPLAVPLTLSITGATGEYAGAGGTLSLSRAGVESLRLALP